MIGETCKFCGLDLDGDEKYCPRCGTITKEKYNMKKIKKSIEKRNDESKNITNLKSTDSYLLYDDEDLKITESMIGAASLLANQGTGKVINNDPVVFIDIINNKSAGIGHMVKPFTIAAEKADKLEKYDVADYFQNISNAAYSANNTVINGYINQILRYPMLDAMQSAYGCIENEFEFLQKENKAHLKNIGLRVVDALLLKFMKMFDITVIRRALESLYSNYNQMNVEDRLAIQHYYIQPLLGTYSLEAVTILSGVIYDWLYATLLCECDSSDFSIVCGVLTPIFIEFRDNIHDIAEIALLRLIEVRASSSIEQDNIFKETPFDE